MGDEGFEPLSHSRDSAEKHIKLHRRGAKCGASGFEFLENAWDELTAKEQSAVLTLTRRFLRTGRRLPTGEWGNRRGAAKSGKSFNSTAASGNLIESELGGPILAARVLTVSPRPKSKAYVIPQKQKQKETKT
jgi:hypothetical protein